MLLMLTVFDDDGTNYVLVDYDRRDDGSRALYGSRQRDDDGVTAAVHLLLQPFDLVVQVGWLEGEV